MGKPTGSGGDERNVDRKQRAGSNSSSNVVKRLGDNESSRLKTGLRQSARQSDRQSISGRIVTKPLTNVTVHTPIKPGLGLGQPTNRASGKAKSPAPSSSSTSNKDQKKPSEAAGAKTKGQAAKMKQESEGKPMVIEIEDSSPSPAEVIKHQQSNDAPANSEVQPTNGEQKNGLNGAEAAAVGANDTADSKTNGSKPSEPNSDEDFDLQLEDQVATKPEKEADNANGNDGNVQKEGSSEASKNDDNSQTSSDVKTLSGPAVDGLQINDTESCSVDVVESTTSELSEATESSSAPSEIRDGEAASSNANVDPAVFNALDKNVRIPLRDCLKDPQCAGYLEIKEQTNPSLERRINTRSKSKLRSEEGGSSQQHEAEGNVPQSESASPQKSQVLIRKLSEVRGRRALRSEPRSYEAISANSSQYQSLLLDSTSSCSINGSTSYFRRNEDKQKRKADSEDNRTEKMLKVVEGDVSVQKKALNDKIEEHQRTETQPEKSELTIKPGFQSPLRVGRWCTIM